MTTLKHLISDDARARLQALTRDENTPRADGRRAATRSVPVPGGAVEVGKAALRRDPKLRALDRRIAALAEQIQTVDGSSSSRRADRELTEILRGYRKLSQQRVRGLEVTARRLRRLEREVRQTVVRYAKRAPVAADPGRTRKAVGALKPPRPLPDKPEPYFPDRPVGWSTGAWFTGGQ